MHLSCLISAAKEQDILSVFGRVPGSACRKMPCCSEGKRLELSFSSDEFKSGAALLVVHTQTPEFCAGASTSSRGCSGSNCDSSFFLVDGPALFCC